MKKYSEELEISEKQVPLPAFLKAYNKDLPASFPKATPSLLKKFREMHPQLFKHGSLWSLDEHRKKLLDWLPPRTQES